MGTQNKVRKFDNGKVKPYNRLRPIPKKSRRYPSKWHWADETKGLSSDLDNKMKDN